MRWSRIQQLFHGALELPAALERASFLETSCGGDRELLGQVQAMLDEDSKAESVLDRGLAAAAHEALADARPSMPSEIGPYRILTLLGEGGMGVVYLGERKDLGGRVAIKVLRDAWLSPARRERFANEQRTLVQLDHPAIAPLYDAGVSSDGTPWFSMEYVEGIPITDYCASRSATVVERVRLFREVCEAVLHAHQHLVVHRDLKPSNILVRPDGAVTLLDFGIAKRIEGIDLMAEATRTGLRLLTPAYAAPELLRGVGVGIQTDVYSLGVILYELLTGRVPFDLEGLTAPQAEALILEHVPVRPSVLARSLPPEPGVLQASRAAWADLDVLGPTAMHKDPARRYRTVEALIRDVDHFLRGEPLEARPDTIGYRVGKFVRRNRAPVSALALCLAALVILASFYTVRLASARNAAVAAAERTRRIQSFTLDLFEGGDPRAGPAANLTVSSLIDRGRLGAASLDGEPEVQAEVYQTLGGMYQKLGDLDRADSLLQSAFDRRSTLLGDTHEDVVASLIALASLRLEQARYPDAERLARDAVDRARMVGGDQHAQATSILGQVLGAQGRYEDAIAVLGAASDERARAAVTTPDPLLADVLYHLADAYFYAGQYDRSEQLNRTVLGMNRALHGDAHPLVADGLVNLGAIQFERGAYSAAERDYRQALEITGSWYGAEHPRTAAHLTMVSRSLVYQGRNDEAADLLEHALAIRRQVYGASHPAVASTLNEIGNIAVAQDRYGDAEDAFAKMVEIYRAAYPEGHYLTGVALANLGSVHMDLGDLGTAETLLRQAIEIYQTQLPSDHVNTGISRIKLGRVLLRQNRPADAEPETREGYEILSTQMDPAVSFLVAARRDLVAVYEALGQPDLAARFQAELDGLSASSPPPAS